MNKKDKTTLRTQANNAKSNQDLCHEARSHGLTMDNKKSLRLSSISLYLLNLQNDPDCNIFQKQAASRINNHIEGLARKNGDNISEDEFANLDRMLDMIRHMPCRTRENELKNQIKTLEDNLSFAEAASFQMVADMFDAQSLSARAGLDAAEVLQRCDGSMPVAIKKIGQLMAERFEKLEQKTAKMKEFFTIDRQTGMKNRYALFEHLEKKISQYQEGKFPIWVVMVGIDGLESMNQKDGDRLIEEFSRNIITGVGDFSARYTGNQFSILLNSASIQTVDAQLSTLKKNLIYFNSDQDSRVTMSIGISNIRDVWDPEKNSDELGYDLIGAAADALCQAKHSGGNSIHYAS